MPKVTKIENAIIQLGDGDFHKLCDTFLSKKGYGVIHGFGIKAGTSKSTIGNPDTYFRTENGRYIFAVYTTQQTRVFDKIQDDILTCFDPNKTGVQERDIEEIICCHTSSRLSPGDDKRLHELCDVHGIKLTIYGVGEIAQQLYNHYPALARDFLNISIDTNQIVSIEEFVRLYDASKTVAPLKTIFQNRNELFSIENGIRENEVVIVYGQAGVGKTRIVLEALRHVSSEDGYRLLCVKNNNLPLFEDLLEHTDKPGNYLFFIDDANELAGINHILDYVNSGQSDYKIKIVMTVRDYARKELYNTVIKRVKPLLIEIPVVSDNDIKSFLNVNFNIINEQFLDTIINISGGNLRIAYMAGQIAIESNSLATVHDATQVFEEYYASIVEPKIASDHSLCLSAGVLSLVKAVMLNRTEFLSELLEYAHLSSEDFYENIHRLFQMEVVEVYMDKMAVFADQCLSNYMLYYVFFLKKMIPFSNILKIGFVHFRKGVIQSVKTLLNIFSKKELCDYIIEEVRKTRDWFSENDTIVYEDFVREFHLFFPEDAFLVVKDIIDRCPQNERKISPIDFNCSPVQGDNRILGFLTGYNFTSYLDTAIELFLEFIIKSGDNAVMGFHWLKECYGVSLKSLDAEFYDVIQTQSFRFLYI